jgi:hypothetical protein
VILVIIIELAHSFFHSNPVLKKNKYGKVDIGRQSLRDIMALGELQSIVIGDGVGLVYALYE